MEIDEWMGPFKIRSFPWIDGKRIYFNVQYYRAGQSIHKPPVWDKTVYITDDPAGQHLVSNYTHTLVEHIEQMHIASGVEVTLTVQTNK